MPQRKIFTLALLFIAVELGLAVFSILTIRSLIIDNVTAQNSQLKLMTAQAVSNTLENDLQNLANNLEIVAGTPEILNGTPAQCRAKLTSVNKILNQVSILSRLNSNGTIDCSTDPGVIGWNRLNQPHVKAIFTDPEHRPILSHTITTITSAQPAVTMLIPTVNSEGQFQGTIVAVLNLRKLQAVFLQPIRFPNSGYITLLDDDGGILYHPNESLIGNNIASASARELDRSERSRLTYILQKSEQIPTGSNSFSQDGNVITAWDTANIMPDHHWLVIISVPKSNVVNEIINSQFLEGSKTWLNLSLISAVTIVTASTLLALILEIPLIARYLAMAMSRFLKELS